MSESIAALKNHLERVKAAARNAREKAEESLGMALTVGEVATSAFIMAYARGRYGNDQDRLLIGSVDADLVIGFGTLAAVFFDTFGRYGSHAASLAAGVLGCYGSLKGFELGHKSRSKSSTSGRPALPATQPRVMAHESIMGAAARETIPR